MVKNKNKLFIIGSINIDLSITCEKLPLQGETIDGKNFNISLGGKGANQSYYASSLGLETLLIGNLGSDHYGEIAKNLLKENNIANCIIKRKSKNTGIAIIINSEQDNRIILNNGANKSFDIKNNDFLDQLTENDYLLSQLEINEEYILEIFKIAKQKKVTTFLNTAPANLKNKDLYKYTDYLILNETECAELLKINVLDCEKKLHEFLEYGVKNIILTMGANGSIFLNKLEKIYQQAISIEVVNTTGAGDSFIGSFIFEFDRTKNIKKSLEFATKVSSVVCKNQEVQVKNIKKIIGE